MGLARIRATVLDLAILAGHLLLYPTGLLQERPPATPPAAPPAGPPGESPAAPTATPPDGSPAAPADAAPGTVAALPTDGPDRRPVLLLHGFIDNRSVFVLLRRSLRRHGRRHVEALNYSPLTCDIRAAAALLDRHVRQICARTGHSRVDVVGHSLGGLIARYYVQRLGGDARVHTLVTLGTPHSGTRTAPLLAAHPLVRQMCPDSDVIEELRRPAPDCRTRFVSFWSDVDQLMIPAETARIDHPDLRARSVPVKGIGHLALPVHHVVAARVRETLDAADEAAADASGAVSVA
ncbi:lipase family alpha/beta hydrolase [Streptomyces sparsogenes]|uniref:Lipase n=1 Tax=Streptomyces sparsogenes DSM 40356 TaxID=1331668 RepID=A0A1R1S5A0_9ACTN|nr:alpha/beta fold hydrolase [Streptomyces sparsogenes]OMI33372.1 lipase [Streptomyces sparsogenes DSM 40356]